MDQCEKGIGGLSQLSLQLLWFIESEGRIGAAGYLAPVGEVIDLNTEEEEEEKGRTMLHTSLY